MNASDSVDTRGENDGFCLCNQTIKVVEYVRHCDKWLHFRPGKIY